MVAAAASVNKSNPASPSPKETRKKISSQSSSSSSSSSHSSASTNGGGYENVAFVPDDCDDEVKGEPKPWAVAPGFRRHRFAH